MRVAHIITRMIIGGAQENTLFNCIDLVEEYGDEVCLVTGPATGPEGKLLEEGRAGGVPIKMVDSLRRAIHPRHDYAAYRELCRLLRELQPDVVHTHSAKGGFLGRAAAWKVGVPAVIHTVHGAPFHEYQNPLVRKLYVWLERWAAKRCHHMISVADAMTERMVSANVAPREMFTTIYSGMDVEPFRNCHKLRDDARAELGYSEQDVVFGKIARLFHLKGHEYLIPAAKAAIDQDSRCKFLLVGDGILKEQLQANIAALNLEEYFTFTGLVPPERVPFYLSAMDVLVHTSLREGLARTLPQALIAQRPVVSYDVDGAREVTLPDTTGFLLPPKSIEPLTHAITTLAGDPELRLRMGQEGASRFTSQFRHQFMTEQIRAVYEKVLARRSRG